MRHFFFTCLICTTFGLASQPLLKYVVYDFDGLDVGQTNLPDGDYSNGDLQHSIAGNPLAPSDVIGDRVVKLDLNWQNNVGEFGKATMRFVDLIPGQDQLSFYIYNPSSNGAPASLRVMLAEDDNGDDVFQGNADDKWGKDLSIPASGSWQLINVPLSDFTDDNSAGNGSLDAKYGSPGGMLFSVGFSFSKPSGGGASSTYYLDMICFTDGGMPHGQSILDLPPGDGGARCALGALGSNPDAAQVPGEIESFLPAGKKLALVNWFEYYSTQGTTPNSYTGQEVQTLLDNGYTPIITWESMFAGYSRLDPVQPRLSNILSGDYDGYIDAFAAKIKSYSGTVIMRILHEFEGDWYSWSLTHNGQDPEKYKSAFRHIVDRFRTAGASNVLWMWCLNAEPKPYVNYNNVVSCYPGDSYVDIVATDIYNHPDLGTPDWKSFRYTLTESYYHLVKHFSHKPLYICEVGSRERYPGEDGSSQTKAEWTCMMSRDLKSYFSKVKALVYFSTQKEHDWRINSSDAAKQAFIDCLWSDSFFGGVVGVPEAIGNAMFRAYPNPFTTHLYLRTAGVPDSGGKVEVRVFDITGHLVFRQSADMLPEFVIMPPDLAPGAYVIEARSDGVVQRQKLLRAFDR